MKITGSNNFNISGLCAAKFTEAKNILSISYPDENNQVVVKLKPNAEWVDLYFTKTAEDVQIKHTIDNSGIYYTDNIKLINPQLNAAKSKSFGYYKERDIIFIITDNNGNSILIGSVNMPARFEFDQVIPGTSRNARSIGIDAVHDDEPLYVIEEVIIKSGAYSDGYSVGFDI